VFFAVNYYYKNIAKIVYSYLLCVPPHPKTEKKEKRKRKRNHYDVHRTLFVCFCVWVIETRAKKIKLKTEEKIQKARGICIEHVVGVFVCK